jgi:hypothetical protein
VKVYNHCGVLSFCNSYENVEIVKVHSALNEITFEENATIVLKDPNDYLEICNLQHYNLKLNFLIFLNQEGISHHARLNVLKESNPLHRIYFCTTHLDSYTIEHDLSFKPKLFGFKHSAFTSNFSNIEFLKENINKKRSKKLNFFNRTINIRRLKAFELVKKQNIDLSDSYNTFAFIMMDNVFGGIRKPSEYVVKIKSYSSVYRELKPDIPYIESKENEFVSYEDREWHCVTDYNVQEGNDIINKNTLDSYVSFVIESSNDTEDDLRFTEKTVRTFLLKTISLLINVPGYNKALRSHGLQTFEDVFELDENWDECGEVERMNKFITALENFNKLSLVEVENIYFSENVQRKLNINFEIIMDSFNDNNLIIKELINKIGYENNVSK